MIIEAGIAPGSKKTFYVHHGLMCHYSKSYEYRFGSDFGETGDKYAPEDIEARLFENVVYWLYTGRLFEGQTPHTSMEDIPLSLMDIAEIYVFAVNNEIPRLKNAAIDLLAAKYAATQPDNSIIPDAEVIDFIYRNTRTSDPARKLLVDEFVECFSCYGDVVREQLHGRFLQDVMVQMWNDKRWLRERDCRCRGEWLRKIRGEMCLFHDHDEGSADVRPLWAEEARVG